MRSSFRSNFTIRQNRNRGTYIARRSCIQEEPVGVLVLPNSCSPQIKLRAALHKRGFEEKVSPPSRPRALRCVEFMTLRNHDRDCGLPVVAGSGRPFPCSVPLHLMRSHNKSSNRRGHCERGESFLACSGFCNATAASLCRVEAVAMLPKWRQETRRKV